MLLIIILLISVEKSPFTETIKKTKEINNQNGTHLLILDTLRYQHVLELCGFLCLNSAVNHQSKEKQKQNS